MKKILTFILIGCMFLGLSLSAFAAISSDYTLIGSYKTRTYYSKSGSAVFIFLNSAGNYGNGYCVIYGYNSATAKTAPVYYSLNGTSVSSSSTGIQLGGYASYDPSSITGDIPVFDASGSSYGQNNMFNPIVDYLVNGVPLPSGITHVNGFSVPDYNPLQAIYDSTLTNLDMLVNFNLIRQSWDSEHPFKSLFNVFLNTLPESNVIGFEMNLLDSARQFLWRTGLFHDTTGGGHKFSLDPVDKTVTVDDEDPLPMPESQPYDITTQPYDFVVRPVTYNTETQTYYYGDWIRVQNINPTYIGSLTIQNYEVTNDYVINLDNSTVDQSSHDNFDNSVTTNNYYSYSVIINNDSSVNVGDIDIPVNFTPVGIIGSGGLSDFWDRFKDIDFVGFLAALGELLAMIFLINPIFLALINFLPLWATTIISSLITITVIFILYKFIRKSLGGAA